MYSCWVFDEVSFSVDDGKDDDSLILTIHLVERTTGSADFGIGYNSTEKFSVYVDVSDDNLLGNGQRETFILIFREKVGIRTRLF